MPSFKLWILSALVLFAIVFPRSTVFADEVPERPTVSFTDETVRTWKDTSGEFTTQAVLVGVQKDMVSLRTKDDRTIQVPLSKLSKADQAYVQSKLKKALSKPTPKPVVADEVPADKGIVGSWKVTFALDPKKAADAKHRIYLDFQISEGSTDFRPDGTFTTQFTFYRDGKSMKHQGNGTWELVNKGTRKYLETTEAGKRKSVGVVRMNEDQFTLAPVDFRKVRFVAGIQYDRKKDAPKEDAPIKNDWIFGSWKVVFRLDPEVFKAELAKVEDPKEKERLNQDYLDIQKADVSYHFLENVYQEQATMYASGIPRKEEVLGTWKLVDKRENRFVLEFSDYALGEEALSCAWINKDQFTVELPECPPFLTAIHVHRKKDAPKP